MSTVRTPVVNVCLSEEQRPALTHGWVICILQHVAEHLGGWSVH